LRNIFHILLAFPQQKRSVWEAPVFTHGHLLCGGFICGGFMRCNTQWFESINGKLWENFPQLLLLLFYLLCIFLLLPIVVTYMSYKMFVSFKSSQWINSISFLSSARDRNNHYQQESMPYLAKYLPYTPCVPQ
jgi:hypothetical protein